MVTETVFADNASQWESYRKDKAAYDKWLKATVKPAGDRSHGFRYRGQYKEQVPAVLELVQKG